MYSRIPFIDTRNTDRLLAVFQGAVVLSFAALLISFWHFQVGQHARFLEMAENNHQRQLALRAPRGVVFDRDGQVLVENRHSLNISLVREQVEDLDRSIGLLAQVTAIDAQAVRDVVDRHRGSAPGRWGGCHDSGSGVTAQMPARTLPFVKMSGAGNDFVVLDNRDGIIRETEKLPLARRACRRKIGIGADGLILVERPVAHEETEDPADFVMRYFNADGSEGELCGNGTRCAAVFAGEIGAAGRSQTIVTPAGVLRAEILSPEAEETAVVRVAMVKPSPIRRVRLPDVPGGEAELFALEVGVPHAIEVVPDVAAVDVDRRGSAIRHDPAFRRVRMRTSSRWTKAPARSTSAPLSAASKRSASPAAPAPRPPPPSPIAFSIGRPLPQFASRAATFSISM